MLAVDACPGCGGHSRLQLEVGPDVRLYRCGVCDLVYAAERGHPDSIYVDGYLSGDLGQFGFDLRHPLAQEALDAIGERRLALLERVARPPGRLLDVGCGAGELLVVARRRGWEVRGIDPVAQAAGMAQARGLGVSTGELEGSELPERYFDVVCATQVLEHMASARAFLHTLGRYVRPGGHVMVEVPNWRSFHRRSAGPGWPGLRPLEHICHFTPATLAALARGADLVPVLVRTPSYLAPSASLEDSLYQLGAHRLLRWLAPLGRPARSADAHQLVPNASGRALLGLLSAVWDRAGVGAFVLMVAQVPEVGALA